MKNLLYSVILELSATTSCTIPATTGHQAHALFLDLIEQVDPALAARLHDEPNYRPFTISPLSGVNGRDDTLFLQPNQLCHLRVTLLDGGPLWRCLSTCFLEVKPMTLRLGKAQFKLNRMLSTPTADTTGWAGFTDWQTLSVTPARRSITLHFASPTSFNLGNRHFALFPQPIFVWDSLMRVWNTYAPPVLQLDKTTLRDFITDNVLVNDYDLHTSTLHFPTHLQKGFTGTCRYLVRGEGDCATQVAVLAEFARYAGVGYKTTMGMGQVRAE